MEVVLGRTCTPSPVRVASLVARATRSGGRSLGGLADLEDLGTADGAGAGGRRFAVLHRDRLSALDLALFLAFEAIASGHVLLRGGGGCSATARRQVAGILSTSGPNWSRTQPGAPAGAMR